MLPISKEYINDSYRYTIACIAYLVVLWHLGVNGRSGAVARGGKVGRFYTSIALFTVVVWTVYPM